MDKKKGKTMKKIIVGISLLIAISTSAHAGVLVLGSGVVSCGKWTKEPNAKNSRLNWVLGYLSGLNFMTREEVLERADSAGIEGAINKYCLENPLEDVVEAANNVFAQLKRMAR